MRLSDPDSFAPNASWKPWDDLVAVWLVLQQARRHPPHTIWTRVWTAGMRKYRPFAEGLRNWSYRPVPVRKECAKCSLGLNGAAIALEASCAEARSVRSKRQPQHPKHQANALTPAALKGI